MKRILKNPSNVDVKTIYRGKEYVVLAKKAIALDDGGHDEQAADYLLQTFNFLIDRTPKIIHPIGEVKKAEPKKI